MKYLILLLFLIPIPAHAFTSDDVFNAVNSDRSKPLIRSVKLDKAAKAKADALVACSCFSHMIGSKTPWDFIKAETTYTGAGENLAAGFENVADMYTAWMNSPSHRWNILYKYTQTGIGISEGILNGRKTVFVVQYFIY